MGATHQKIIIAPASASGLIQLESAVSTGEQDDRGFCVWRTYHKKSLRHPVACRDIDDFVLGADRGYRHSSSGFPYARARRTAGLRPLPGETPTAVYARQRIGQCI